MKNTTTITIGIKNKHLKILNINNAKIAIPAVIAKNFIIFPIISA